MEWSFYHLPGAAVHEGCFLWLSTVWISVAPFHWICFASCHTNLRCGIRVLLKTGPRPSPRPAATVQRPGGPKAYRPAAHGPRPTMAQRPGGLVAQSWFSIHFFPAVNPRACTDLHRVLVCKMDDGEFEFVYHLIIWILVSVCYMLLR